MNTDRYRFIIGGLLLGGLLTLAAFIALGHVEEKTSYGLTGIMTIIGKAVLDFTGWAFRLYQGDEVKKGEKGEKGDRGTAATLPGATGVPEGGATDPPGLT